MALLTGIRVLDLSRVLAGPYCTGLLADLGADVLKIESPGGDDARHLGPFIGDESVYFAQLNRGKRSLALDLKNDDDRATFFRLVDAADVVVENFRPGVTTRLGIDAATLRERNPRLVYASISGFGQSGPMAKAPAYDLIAQAMSGLMAATGPEDGGPTRVGESLGDVSAGVFAALAICAALTHRERSGRGEHVDVSMFESLLSLQVTGLSILSATGEPGRRVGNRHPVTTPFDTFEASDGPVAIAVANEVGFARFAGMIEQPDLPADPRFSNDTQRTAHEPELKAIIESWTGRRTVAEVVAAADEHGVPAAPVWDLSQALECDQVAERGAVRHFEAPTIGRLPYVRAPFVVADEELPEHTSSPALGADTDVVEEWTADR